MKFMYCEAPASLFIFLSARGLASAALCKAQTQGFGLYNH
jgi:hypothetical protein